MGHDERSSLEYIYVGLEVLVGICMGVWVTSSFFIRLPGRKVVILFYRPPTHTLHLFRRDLPKVRYFDPFFSVKLGSILSVTEHIHALP